ncbi:MAG TPA: hypothetical protein VHE35_04085 [Kofleriaceae bacterium]|nr:hypothetical protein [Kofleriaceae bacterium]
MDEARRRRTTVWAGAVVALAGCGLSAPPRTGGAVVVESVARDAGAARPAPPVADAGPAADAPYAGPAVKAIGVGEHVSCALLESGDVRCWGATRLATPATATPVPVGIDDGAALAVGLLHVCVARRDGSVWCWGDNRDGQLGDGTTESRGAPARVPDVGGIVELVAGGHQTCARDLAGAVWCWGEAYMVGHAGSALAARRPGRVAGVDHATRLVAGDDITCAFVAGGPPRCWGFNTTGLLGRAPGPLRHAVPSPPLARAVTLAIGFRQACLTQADGLVYCGGDDPFGQLGDQDVPDDAQCDPYDRRGVVCRWTDHPPPDDDDRRCLRCPTRPDEVPPPPPPATHERVFAARNGFVLAGGVQATALAAGHGRTCALTPAGAVTCWGQWYYGRDWAYHRPHVIAGTDGAIALAVAEEHACALLADHAVRCWGYTRSGELGAGVTTHELTLFAAAATVRF